MQFTNTYFIMCYLDKVNPSLVWWNFMRPRYNMQLPQHHTNSSFGLSINNGCRWLHCFNSSFGFPIVGEFIFHWFSNTNPCESPLGNFTWSQTIVFNINVINFFRSCRFSISAYINCSMNCLFEVFSFLIFVCLLISIILSSLLWSLPNSVL